MPRTKFVDWPKFEEYKEMFKEHFYMEKRDDGVLLVRMHTKGEPQMWSMELHRAIGQMWRTVGSDSNVELVIFMGTGDKWIMDFERESWAPEETEPAYTRYEHMFIDGRRMLIAMIQDVEVPTIGLLSGTGGHAELALMCDIVLMADDVVIADPHFLYDIVPGDGIHSCLIELMGVRRAAYAMYMSQKLTAQQCLEYGLVNEVVPRDRLLPRAYEIADFIMARHRTIRRLTAQVVRQPWKKRLANDLDMTFGTEMFGDFCKSVQHSNLKASDYFYGTGENIFYDKEKAQKQAEEARKTEKSIYRKK
jgi:enoyl-CoA hydratase/carnithine racemase